MPLTVTIRQASVMLGVCDATVRRMGDAGHFALVWTPDRHKVLVSLPSLLHYLGTSDEIITELLRDQFDSVCGNPEQTPTGRHPIAVPPLPPPRRSGAHKRTGSATAKNPEVEVHMARFRRAARKAQQQAKGES